MRSIRNAFLLVSFLAMAGCYHAIIETGLQPNGQVVTKPWANSFLDGLVPPPIVETASKCPNGVARVETQHSFLNEVATVITFGIYSPMTITVQCAGGRTGMVPRDGAGMVEVPAGASRSARTAAVKRAVDLSRSSGEPAWLLFE